jgi:mannose-6-phosphate isomerase-like protein (cupin superfamily)
MNTTSKGFLVRSGESRTGASLEFLNGRFDCKISAKDTGGALCAFDSYRFRPGGPRLHLHFEQDEWFLVLEGEFKFQVGDDTFMARAGDSVFGPRRVPHAFRNISETGRLVVTFLPALTMEVFFASPIIDPMSQEFLDHSRRHGMEIVGPPLSHEAE